MWPVRSGWCRDRAPGAAGGSAVGGRGRGRQEDGRGPATPPVQGRRTLEADQRLRPSARLASPMSVLREASRWTSRSRARESSRARIGFMTPMLWPSTSSSSVALRRMAPSLSTALRAETPWPSTSSSVALRRMAPSLSTALRAETPWPSTSSSVALRRMAPSLSTALRAETPWPSTSSSVALRRMAPSLSTALRAETPWPSTSSPRWLDGR